MEQIIKLIREKAQFDLYTVGDAWHLQLFDLDVAANDQIECIWEDDGTTAMQVLNKGLQYLYQGVFENCPKFEHFSCSICDGDYCSHVFSR